MVVHIAFAVGQIIQTADPIITMSLSMFHPWMIAEPDVKLHLDALVLNMTQETKMVTVKFGQRRLRPPTTMKGTRGRPVCGMQHLKPN